MDHPLEIRRPALVTLLAVMHGLAAAVYLCLTLWLVLTSSAAGRFDVASGAFVGLAAAWIGVLMILHAACAIGLWTLRPFGRVLEIGLAVLGLLAIPFGTVIAILVLVYFFKPGVKLLFSGRPAADFRDEERASIRDVLRPQTAMIVVILLVAIAMPATVGIVAAIAVPGLLRARMSGNEVSAMATLRAVQSSQASFSTVNGLFASVECLQDSSRCDPPSTESPVLDPARQRAGYRYEFFAGPRGNLSGRAAPGERPTAGVTSYVVVAVPDSFGSTGSRSFCADSTGLVCAVAAASIMPEGDRCPAACVAVDTGGPVRR